MKRGSIKDPLLAAAPRASSCLHRQACTQPFQQPPRAAPRAVRPVRAPTVYTAVCFHPNGVRDLSTDAALQLQCGLPIDDYCIS